MHTSARKKNKKKIGRKGVNVQCVLYACSSVLVPWLVCNHSILHSFIHSFVHSFFFCIFARSTKTNFHVVIQSSISYSCVNATAAISKQSFGNLSLSLKRPMMILLVFSRTPSATHPYPSIASQSALFSLSFTLFTPSTRFSFSPSSFLAQFHFSSNDGKVHRASTRLDNLLTLLLRKKRVA